MLKNFSKILRNNLDPFFSSADPGSRIRIRIKISWILSTEKNIDILKKERASQAYPEDDGGHTRDLLIPKLHFKK